jgi:hypothetical protein
MCCGENKKRTGQAHDPYDLWLKSQTKDIVFAIKDMTFRCIINIQTFDFIACLILLYLYIHSNNVNI